MNALAVMVTTGGGYLPFATRSLIDSILSTCISSIRPESGSQIASWPPVQTGTIKLGMACLCTPWPDGAMSAILDELKVIARIYSRDCESMVAMTANICVRLCDALSTPRAPALDIVTRASISNGKRSLGQDTTSAASMIADLNSAQEEMKSQENSLGLPSSSINTEEIKQKPDNKKWRQTLSSSR